MAGIIVESAEHSVFERDATLATPVVATKERHHIGDGVGFLHGHDAEALLGERIVQADGHMTAALVEEALEAGDDAHSGDGDAVRAPSQTPRSCEHLGAAEDVVEIVHRFAHAHIHDIGEEMELGDGEDLVEDFGGGEAAMESLLAGDTEAATHLAAHLTRYTEGAAVAVGDEYGLDVLGLAGDGGGALEEVFLGAIGRHLAVDGGVAADVGYLAEAGAGFEREVGHEVDIAYLLDIEPVADLLGGELGQAFVGTELLELFEGFS